jgi:methyl coenzyme M reductase beta subunit
MMPLKELMGQKHDAMAPNAYAQEDVKLAFTKFYNVAQKESLAAIPSSFNKMIMQNKILVATIGNSNIVIENARINGKDDTINNVSFDVLERACEVIAAESKYIDHFELKKVKTYTQHSKYTSDTIAVIATLK